MNSRFFIHITLLFAAVAFLACSSEDDMSALGGQPLVLYADMPMTRSTVDNQWSVGDEVAVKIGDEIKIYYIKDAETGELTTFGNSDPFRWSPDFDSVEVTAWSLGGFVEAEPLTGITIPKDQSPENVGYTRHDLLYAKGTLTPSNTHLTFYHQLARVIVQLKFKTTVELDDISVNLGSDYDEEGNSIDIVPLTADFSAPTGNANYGTWNNFTNYPEYGGITMFHDATAEDGYDAAFSALLIPNDYSGTRFIGIDAISDMGLYYFIPSYGEANLQSGRTYTYRITVYNDFLDVTVGTDDGGTNNSVTPWSPNN